MFEDLKHLRYVERDRIAVLTVDRPGVHNAIGLTTMPELARVSSISNARPISPRWW